MTFRAHFTQGRTTFLPEILVSLSDEHKFPVIVFVSLRVEQQFYICFFVSLCVEQQL